MAAIILYPLLVHVLNRIREEDHSETNRTIALLAVLLFVVHPVNVESVSWIASRKYGLMAFFTFLSFYLYVKSTDKGKHYVLEYLFSILTYILALLSSPFGVVLPSLILLYDFCRSYKTSYLRYLRNHYYYYIPYLLMAIGQFILLLNLVSTSPAPTVKEHYAGDYFYTLFTMLRVLYDYLKNLLFPFWLNSRYFDHVSLTFFEHKVLISSLLLVVIVVILLIQLKSQKTIVVFCFGWFFLSLLPVSNIIPISTKMADRYLYLPAIGLFLLFSFGLANLAETCFASRLKRIALLSIAIPVLFTCSYLSIQRNKVWANSLTLWEDSLKKTPHNFLAHLNLGEALQRQGRLEEAISHYQQALRLKPDYGAAQLNLASALAEQGKFKQANEHYQEALKLKPNDAGIHNNFATFLAQQGKIDEAIAHFSKAVQIRPDFAEVYNNLGNVFKQQGKVDEAFANYSKALEIKPSYAEAHNNLGVLLAKRGRLKEATNHYSEALRLNPDSAETHNNLAVALVELGEIEAAISHYAKAIDLQPDYAEAHNNLGNALSAQGKLKEAIASLSKALAMRPHYPEANNNLGVALARQGRLHEAIGQFKKALQFKPDYAQARANLGIALEMVSKTNEASTIEKIP